MAVTIPGKSRPEWRKMISGEIEHEFNNYVLQKTIYQLRQEIFKRNLTYEKAIDQLYELCSKYALAVQIDFRQIFKSW
ncbi:MAG: hypothetical protein NTU44_10880 [Bacteroidetes bacterium]|nr:hypothetical protein [Bacteroidota bacterium]